ncbi:DUF1853 family protein [Hydrocarboniclastica marina]|uniref:DUF1853 family protein n=1 Tax=Hydrocarboniclastica marina TaxID=2259620 RepID=A0A4P7XG47_9ALTE|nr:DUF1853 family protein [Hydrocarboniclastica marina]
MCTYGYSPDSLFVRHRFRTPAVRHLAWLVRSEPLLTHYQGKDNVSGATAWPGSVDETLLELDRNPEALLAHLQSRPSRRLGLYFEQLYGFALTALLGQRILAQNLPIRVGGRTLGELDFLVADPATGRIVHHEIAVKYYMGWPDLNADVNSVNRDRAEEPRVDGKPLGWYGPDTRDQLSAKLRRLREHQLPLWRSEAGRACLRSEGLPEIETSHLGLYGYLFRHYQATTPPLPDEITIPAPEHTWRKADEFQCSAADTPRIRIRKPDWLGPLQLADDFRPDPSEPGAIAEESQQRPVLVATMDRTEQGFWLERAREFVVPNSWCRTIRTPEPDGAARTYHQSRP